MSLSWSAVKFGTVRGWGPAAGALTDEAVTRPDIELVGIDRVYHES